MGDVLHGDGQEFSDSKKDTMTSSKRKKKHVTNQSHTGIVMVNIIIMETGTYKDVQNTEWAKSGLATASLMPAGTEGGRF